MENGGEPPSERLITVPGDPVPWGAARVTQPKEKDGRPGRFVPQRQTRRASEIAQAWIDAGHGLYPAELPLAIGCEFICRRPKSQYGTGKNAGVLKERFRGARPTGRPDLSNLVKLVEDGLKNLAFADDDQIAQIHAVKLYVNSPEEQPRTVVRLAPLEST